MLLKSMEVSVFAEKSSTKSTQNSIRQRYIKVTLKKAGLTKQTGF